MSDSGALLNVLSRAELLGLARRRRLGEVRSTVRLKDLEEELQVDGARLIRRNRATAVVARPKGHDIDLEDRVWTLMYRMGFSALSGDGGAVVRVSQEPSGTLTNQIDVLASDNETVLAIECKSQSQRGRRPQLQSELAKHGSIREPLSRAVSQETGAGPKRPVITVLWTHNAVHSANDEERAAQHGVALLGDSDLEYYETLVAQLGAAARFQLLADLIPGRPIPNLTTRVPALQSKMGGYTCYTFAIQPEYLLKIAYVSHRARGKDSDIQTYQRMVSRSRLRKIAKYIDEPGSTFPTNIVVNLEPGRKGAGASFQRVKQEGDDIGATFGWLALRPTYRSAWIIDGQHRLFAYAFADPSRAANGRLSILAFEGLPGSVQQQLFVDINAEQKSVRKSLLQELYADLHRSSDDPSKRTQALISRGIQELDTDPESAFFDRIQLADSPRTPKRCISLNAIFSALDKPGFYYGHVKDNAVVDPGPFWDRTDAATIRRSTRILNGWFDGILEGAGDWWDLGAEDGGGLAMNDGVTVCVGVLRSVIEHLEGPRTHLNRMTSTEVVGVLRPFALALGEYFGSLSAADRLAFRALRGQQGHSTGVRRAQAAIQKVFPDFDPPGLSDFLEREKAKTNERAQSLISSIEIVLAKAVIGILKAEFGTENDAWWWEGVPKAVRTKVSEKQDEDKNAAGSREAYMDFIHYRLIALANWVSVGPIVAFAKSGTKDRKTDWMVRVNEIRKVAMHASRGATVSFEQIAELEEYLAILSAHVESDSRDPAEVDDGDPPHPESSED